MSLKAWLIEKAIQGKLPMWMYRLIGTIAAKELHLTEDNMDAQTAATTSKPWYQSKTVWTAIIGAVLGLVQPLTTAIGHPFQIPLWVFEFLSGLGLYTLRTSTTTIQ